MSDRIVIINRSTVLTDEQVQNVIPALQAQVSQDFAPIWGVDAELEFHGGGNPNDMGHLADDWPLYIYDNTDTPGAGGYHVDENGRVSGKVFAADAIEAGEAWTVDASHELLEMLADPTAGTDPSKYVDLQDRYAGYQCLPEVCDAVESDALGYERPGADGQPVTLSDFVTPAYFYEQNPPGFATDRYAFKSAALTAPAPALLQGGYLGIHEPDGNWTQVSMFDMATGRRSRRSLRHGRTAFAAQQTGVKP